MSHRLLVIESAHGALEIGRVTITTVAGQRRVTLALDSGEGEAIWQGGGRIDESDHLLDGVGPQRDSLEDAGDDGLIRDSRVALAVMPAAPARGLRWRGSPELRTRIEMAVVVRVADEAERA